MLGHQADLNFPACCAHCPYLEPVDASCSHEHRQALIQEVTATRTCSVYTERKTAMMRDLSTLL